MFTNLAGVVTSPRPTVLAVSDAAVRRRRTVRMARLS